MFFEGHYIDWRRKRFNFLVDTLGKDYFRDKTLLEVGAGCGHLGQMFYEIGAKVMCVEGRSINVERGQKMHPKLKWLEWNLEKDLPQGQRYDIILDTGLFYHLMNVDKHLLDVIPLIKIGGILILEGEVANSDDPFFFIQTIEDKKGNDSSISGFGIRPSAAYIERALTNLHINFTRYDDEKLNTELHKYNWQVTNQPNGQYGWWGAGLRRLWICKHQ